MTPERIDEIKWKLAQKKNVTGSLDEIERVCLELLAALEETQHLLQDHGPNGRNYTNQQYVGLGYQLAEEKAFREETDKELRQAEAENVKLVNELAEAQQTIARQLEFSLERLLLEMWDAAGIEEIYKYKHRIKVFKRPGLVSYELFCDLTYRMFQDVYDTANDNHTTTEEAKVSVRALLEALGNKEGETQP